VIEGGSSSEGGRDNDGRGTDTEVSEQAVRYLCVANRSGQDLTVYVKVNEDDQPWIWSIPDGRTAYLAAEGERLAASAVYIWAESGSGTKWTKNKDDVRNLVPAPCQANEVRTFACTFNP
jgi:hypothetical protein